MKLKSSVAVLLDGTLLRSKTISSKGNNIEYFLSLKNGKREEDEKGFLVQGFRIAEH